MKTNYMLIIIFQKLRSSGNHSFSALQLEVVNQNLSTVNGVWNQMILLHVSREKQIGIWGE